MIVLALSGVALSGYLLFNHYGLVDGAVCSISATVSCDAVNRSGYAVLIGVPVALWGLLGFLAIFAVAYLGRFHSGTWIGSRAGIFILALAVLGATFASYLSYLEVFVIHSICPLCVAAFGVDLAILAIAAMGIR